MEWTPRAHRRVAGAHRRAQGRVPAPLREPQGRQARPAVRHPGDRPRHRARRDHLHRRRPAPDVGDPVLQVTQYPRQFISSGGLGTMGFGLPASIGAKIGRPDKTVIDISGDGGFQMTMQELATAVQLRRARRGLHPQQRLPGHGPPVAGPLLEQALLVHLRRGAAGLQAPRRGVRGRRHDGHRRRTRSRRPCARRSTASGRWSSTSGPPPRRTCSRWSRRGARSPR